MIEHIFVYSEWGHRANWIVQHLRKIYKTQHVCKVDICSIKSINKPDNAILIVVTGAAVPLFKSDEHRFKKVVNMSFDDIFDGALDKELI